MDALDRARQRQSGSELTATGSRRAQAQSRTHSLAPCKERIAHSLVDRSRLAGLAGQELMQSPIHGSRGVCQVRFKIKAGSRTGTRWCLCHAPEVKQRGRLKQARSQTKRDSARQARGKTSILPLATRAQGKHEQKNHAAADTESHTDQGCDHWINSIVLRLRSFIKPSTAVHHPPMCRRFALGCCHKHHSEQWIYSTGLSHCQAESWTICLSSGQN